MATYACKIIVKKKQHLSDKVELCKDYVENMMYCIGGVINYEYGNKKFQLKIIGIEYNYIGYLKAVDIITEPIIKEMTEIGICDVKSFLTSYPKEIIALYDYDIERTDKTLLNYNYMLLLNTLPYTQYKNIIYTFLNNAKSTNLEKYLSHIFTNDIGIDTKLVELLLKTSTNFIQDIFKKYHERIKPYLTQSLKEKLEKKFEKIKFPFNNNDILPKQDTEINFDVYPI